MAAFEGAEGQTLSPTAGRSHAAAGAGAGAHRASRVERHRSTPAVVPEEMKVLYKDGYRWDNPFEFEELGRYLGFPGKASWGYWPCEAEDAAVQKCGLLSVKLMKELLAEIDCPTHGLKDERGYALRLAAVLDAQHGTRERRQAELEAVVARQRAEADDLHEKLRGSAAWQLAAGAGQGVRELRAHFVRLREDVGAVLVGRRREEARMAHQMADMVQAHSAELAAAAEGRREAVAARLEAASRVGVALQEHLRGVVAQDDGGGGGGGDSVGSLPQSLREAHNALRAALQAKVAVFLKEEGLLAEASETQRAAVERRMDSDAAEVGLPHHVETLVDADLGHFRLLDSLLLLAGGVEAVAARGREAAAARAALEAEVEGLRLEVDGLRQMMHEEATQQDEVRRRQDEEAARRQVEQRRRSTAPGAAAALRALETHLAQAAAASAGGGGRRKTGGGAADETCTLLLGLVERFSSPGLRQSLLPPPPPPPQQPPPLVAHAAPELARREEKAPEAVRVVREGEVSVRSRACGSDIKYNHRQFMACAKLLELVESDTKRLRRLNNKVQDIRRKQQAKWSALLCGAGAEAADSKGVADAAETPAVSALDSLLKLVGEGGGGTGEAAEGWGGVEAHGTRARGLSPRVQELMRERLRGGDDGGEEEDEKAKEENQGSGGSNLKAGVATAMQELGILSSALARKKDTRAVDELQRRLLSRKQPQQEGGGAGGLPTLGASTTPPPAALQSTDMVAQVPGSANAALRLLAIRRNKDELRSFAAPPKMHDKTVNLVLKQFAGARVKTPP